MVVNLENKRKILETLMDTDDGNIANNILHKICHNNAFLFN